MVNDNSKPVELERIAGHSEIATISERYSVGEDGIYKIREELRTYGILEGRQLIIPKDTFIEAFKKYLGGTL